MSQPSIAVVGSCNIDLITYTNTLPRPGETIFGNDFKKGFGGKGANQAVMAARLGAKVEMVGMLGKDSFADETMHNFKESNVGSDHVIQTDEAPSGTATIIVDSSGTNIIIVTSGANHKVTPQDIEKASSVIKSSKILVQQLEIPIPSVIAAMKIAKQNGVKTILNPAPAQTGLPNELFELSDIVCPNETETEILTGIPVNEISDAEKAAAVLHQKGAKQVLITLGERGSVLIGKGEKPIHIPAEKVAKVTDTTGAGDCYIGSLAFYLAHGKSMEEAMLRATQICAIKVQGYGAQSSYPWMKDLPKEFQV